MARVTDEQLDEKARDVLFHFMGRAKPSKTEETQAKVAASVFSTVSRRQQSAGARELTALAYVRELVSDPQKRAEYLRTALPSSTFVKALPSA